MLLRQLRNCVPIINAPSRQPQLVDRKRFAQRERDDLRRAGYVKTSPEHVTS
jgi:hypothetical protein